MKTKIIYFIVAFLMLRSNSFSQSSATSREIFLANLKINQILPTDNAFVNSNWTSTIKWYEYYGSMMNNSKYLNSINDEFRSEEYKKGLIDEILTGWNNLDLNKQFFFSYNLKFGTYNSQCQCFPFESRYLPSYTLLSARDFANWRRPLTGSYFDINLTNFFNFNDFDFSLRVKSSEAEKFIAARKDGYGNINRTIQAKVIFNFVNKPIESKKNDYNLGCYIRKIEFYDNGRIISTLIPKTDYYDKVNFIKIKNGTDTVYYDSQDNPVADGNHSLASYYRVTTYEDAKQTGIIEDYYINGALQMTGWLDEGIRNGKFTWYYGYGQKFSEVKYRNGIMDGVYTGWYASGTKKNMVTYERGIKNGPSIEWFDNGYKKSEVSYTSDYKVGCDYNWDENGKCKSGAWAAWGGYVDYYENGTTKIGSSKCPCIDQNTASNSKPELQNNNTKTKESITGWTPAQREAFMSECLVGANNAFGKKKGKPYCECMMSKVESKFPNYSESGVLLAREINSQEWKNNAQNCLK